MLKKITILIITCLFAMTTLSGCTTETSVKNMIEEALEKRYGEEFVCHDTWYDNDGAYYTTSYYGLCSPKDSPDILFEVLINDEGRLWRDEYVSMTASKEFTNLFNEYVGNNWGEHYTYCYNYGMIYDEMTVPCFINGEFSLESYRKHIISLFDDNRLTLYYTICVNTSNQHDDAAKEYKTLINALKHIYDITKSQGIELKFSLDIYFINSDVYHNCVDYIQNNAILRSDFCEIVDGKPHLKHECVIQIECENGKVSIDENEYIALRKEFY